MILLQVHKDVRTKSQKIDLLSVRTQHIFRKFEVFVPKVRTSASEETPPSVSEKCLYWILPLQTADVFYGQLFTKTSASN